MKEIGWMKAIKKCGQISKHYLRDLRLGLDRSDRAYECPDRIGPDTGQDWIWTCIFNILPNKYGLSYGKVPGQKKLVSKNLNWDVFENENKILRKKSLKNIFEKKSFFGFFLLFLKVSKVRRPGWKTSGFGTVWILKICRTSIPDVMSGRALLKVDQFISKSSSARSFYEDEQRGHWMSATRSQNGQKAELRAILR